MSRRHLELCKAGDSLGTRQSSSRKRRSVEHRRYAEVRLRLHMQQRRTYAESAGGGALHRP